MSEETNTGADLRIVLDADGWLQVGPDIAQMLRLLLEDIGCNVANCDAMLDAIGDVRSGRRADYHTTTDVLHIHVLPQHVSFTIAAKLTRNPAVVFALDEIEDAIQQLRAFTLTLPEDQRW